MNEPNRRGRAWAVGLLLVFYLAQVVLWIVLLFYVPALMRSLADTGEKLGELTRWTIETSEFARRGFVIAASVSVLIYVGLGVLVRHRGGELWVRVLLGVLAALSLLHLSVVFLGLGLPAAGIP